MVSESVIETNKLQQLASAYVSSGIRYRPEESPFRVLFADITHRCNMACRNCYIPVRDLPDLPVDWLYDILERLPHRTRIRLVGAEPTMRPDLPDIIRRVRQSGHIPIILSNGLNLRFPSYVKKLKAAGLRTLHLSLNGGLRDDLYLQIDNLACATQKLQALNNLQAHRMNITVGMILVPGVNDWHLPEFLNDLLQRGIRDIHFRSVGAVGTYMDVSAFDLDGLERCLRNGLGNLADGLECVHAEHSARDYRLGKVHFQLTQWPDLGSRVRGRVTPEGFIEPMFESMIANENQY